MISTFFLIISAACANEFEDPPVYNTDTLLTLSDLPSGVDTANPITSDGFFRIYQLTTPYGTYDLEGDAFLKMRLGEMTAVAKLTEVELTDTFKNSFEQAIKAPIGFVQGAVQDPGRAVQKTLTGVSRLFDRAASGLRNIGKDQDGIAESLLGISKAKREIAISLDVDPYTDFEPLSKKLDRAAQASAAGGLTVRGLLTLIPGGVGIAASSASTASEITGLVRDRTTSELLEINRNKLARAVGNKPSVNAFFENSNFTPTDQTIIAEALFKLRDVKNVATFLARIASAAERSQAIFLRERALMHALFSEQHTPILQFTIAGSVPLAVGEEEQIIALFPIDAFAWTKRTAGIVESVFLETQNGTSDRSVELIITGDVTQLAQKKISEFGWKLTQKYKTSPPE